MNVILILTFLIGLPTFKSDLRNIGDVELAEKIITVGGVPFFLSFTFDRGIVDGIQSIKSDNFKNYLDFVNELGGNMAFGGMALSYLAGVAGENSKLQDFSITSLESMLLAGGTSVLIKFLVGRARPTSSSTPYKFKPFNLDDEYQALPSGHTSVAFAWLTVFANYYGNNNDILKYVSYALATSVAIARVYKNRHWFSDCVLGAMIGFYFGKELSNLHLMEGGKP